MNEQILKGNWKQAKGMIKQKWGKMTDDELNQIEGNSEKLMGKLQEKYGYSLDEARSNLNLFLEKMNKRMDS